MPEHLILTLEAPMVAFGGEAIDNRGVVRDFPALSMLTGLIANALGWDRTEGARLDALQARIDFAAARLRPGHRRQEYQTARLFEREAGWTTRGRPEGRAPSPSFAWDARWEAERGERAKSLTHQRQRDFDADACTVVALTLTSSHDGPGLPEVEEALQRPERPLFIGRKPCLPSGPICGAEPVTAPSPPAALAEALARQGLVAKVRLQWSPAPQDRPGQSHKLGAMRLHTERRHRIADIRRHVAGVHGGSREVAEGVLILDEQPA